MKWLWFAKTLVMRLLLKKPTGEFCRTNPAIAANPQNEDKLMTVSVGRFSSPYSYR